MVTRNLIMKISEMEDGQKLFTQLGSTVLAVLSKNCDGWRVYVKGVPGIDHTQEWQEVAATGDKQNPEVAKAIVENLFHPGFEIDMPYVS